MTCPNCGYCPHCGRGGYQFQQPYYPPYYQGQPIWYSRPNGFPCQGGSFGNG